MKKKIIFLALSFAVVTFSVAALSSCGGGGKAARAVEKIIKGGGKAAKGGFKYSDDVYRAINDD